MSPRPTATNAEGSLAMAPTTRGPRAASAASATPAVPPPGDAQDGHVVVAQTVGGLSNVAGLRRFFAKLTALDDRSAHDDVYVVQLGDSHTAVDWESGVVRRMLQSRFGDGGRGYVPLGKPLPSYVQEGVRAGMTHDWWVERSKPVKGKMVGDGLYGLAGSSIETAASGARAWAEVAHHGSRIDLGFLEQPGGGSFDLFVDGARLARITTNGRAIQAGWKAFTVADGPHHLEARATGDGTVRLFGVNYDKDAVGLVYDAIGINGARITTPLHWNEGHFTEQLRHHPPDLVVLAYGTNEAGDDTSPTTYERQLVDMLGRIARATPTAACLLLGPPDRAIKTHEGWVTPPKLLEVIASQERVAHAAGCAFYNQFEAMGGAGTITGWANEVNSRAGRDHVHFTRDGYAELGGLFANDLLRAYATFRANGGLPLFERDKDLLRRDGPDGPAPAPPPQPADVERKVPVAANR
jgi:lysophospholipase L1-like esterase